MDNNIMNDTTETEIQAFDTKKIKALVLSGGGVKFAIQIGTLQTLEKKGFWKREFIKSIYASSAGCWTAIIISLGIDWDIINDYIIERQWHNDVDLNPELLLNMCDKKGLYDFNILYVFFTSIFVSKNIDLNITFKEFYDINGIELHFYTIELNTVTTVDLSWKTHPDLKILEGVYMSSSLPFIFTPICKDDRCFLDGGITTNYPLNYCLNSIDVETGEKYLEENILSFRNFYDLENDNFKNVVNDDTNLYSFFFILMNKFANIVDTEISQKTIKNELKCNHKKLSIEEIFYFLNDKNYRSVLIQKGIDIGQQFLSLL